MSGTALAKFICGATVYGGEGVRPDGPCGEAIVTTLFNDGQYTNFTVDLDWHIDLGTQPENTIVRCPAHCRWTKMGESPTGAAYPLPGGVWEDSP